MAEPWKIPGDSGNMGKLSKFTITMNAALTVSDEMAERCLRLLEMWQSDNPHKRIEGTTLPGGNVGFRIVNLGGKADE